MTTEDEEEVGLGRCFTLFCGPGMSEVRKNGSFEAVSTSGWDDDRIEQRQLARAKIQNVEHKVSLIHQAQSSQRSQRQLRASVRGKTVHLDDADFQPLVFEKTNQELVFLANAVKDNFLFGDLSQVELQTCLDAMQKEVVASGTTIVQQGDVGDFFYILQYGRVEFDDLGDRVGVCRPGESFGELALLYESPRAVSCVATGDGESVLWKLDQVSFRHLISKHAQQHDDRIQDVLRRISVFKSLDDSALLRFANTLTHVHWNEGERIVQKGQIGTVFYIVLEGKVKIHDIGLGDSQFEDQILESGQWFGERALLTGEKRAANATALESVTTLATDRETFEEILGPLQSFFDKDMRKNMLKSLSLFASSSITDYELDQLVTLMSECCYRQGDKLAEAGKPYQMNLWIIRHGSLLVQNEDNEERMFVMQSGDYFGGKSIRGDPNHISSHTAICEENLTAWVLTRSDIESVIGDVERLGQFTNFSKSEEDKNIRLKDLVRHSMLGRGAYGKVWLVSHKEKSGSSYAMKVIAKRHLLDNHQEKSVLREKEFLWLLQHPFILHMVCSFQDERNLYLVLPLVPGGELFALHHKQENKIFPDKQAAFYAACIIEALGHCHIRNIAYRDLKLENILLDEDGYCRVVDLGFAKIVQSKTYTLVGTPEYLAPEIIMSKGHDKAVDYWSYGVLVYELLCGTSPFFRRGSSQMDMFKRIVRVEYTVPSFVNISAAALIQKLLVRNPINRLGNLSKGYLDVKNNRWFVDCDISYKELLKKELEAPWKPDVTNSLDTSNFDDFQDDDDQDYDGAHLTKEEQEKFKGF